LDQSLFLFFNNLEEVVKINSVETDAFVMSVLATTEGCDCINHKSMKEFLPMATLASSLEYGTRILNTL